MATISRRRRPVRKVRKKRRKPRRRPVAVKRPPVVSKPAPVTPTPRPTPTPTPAPTPTPSPTPPQPLTPSGEYAVVATPAMAATLRATAAERLFLNRFGTGFSQRALQQLRTVGTPQEWLGAQLRPTGFQEHPKVATVDAWFASLRTDSPATRWSNQVNNRKGGWVYGHELGNWAILRRIYSERTVLERMTDFWATNLHVPQSHDRAWIWRFDYDRVLREHALGRFEDLLREASLHPAMRLYLDNYRSRKGSPNENQGRELLELHSVGVGAGYTEQMVKDSAKILSGWTVAWDTSKGNFAPFYDPRAHTTGAVSVLGFQHANAADDGQQVTLDYLRHLAHHPATARNLARKLALYLVSDDPSEALVEELAQAYLEADTSIAAMLTRLASHPEFLASTGRKVRTPIDDLVATARVLQVEVTKAHTNADGDDSYARHANWTHASQQAFSWPRPDGPPVRGSAWATPSRMFGSYSMHWNHAGGYWPKGATYAAAASWLPKASLSLDEMTEHLCQRWLGRASDARLRQTVRQALTDPGASPMSASTVVSTDSPVIRWMFVRLTAALLDSPDHMTT